jgi:hypothetical protein
MSASEPLLVYEMVTHFPTRRGNVRVVVERSGEVRAHRNDAEPAEGEEWTHPFAAQPRAVIRDAESHLLRVLDRGGFFAMDPNQVNEAATDGVKRTLTWNGTKGPRTVTVDRVRSPRFEALVNELWKALGIAAI